MEIKIREICKLLEWTEQRSVPTRHEDIKQKIFKDVEDLFQPTQKRVLDQQKEIN